MAVRGSVVGCEAHGGRASTFVCRHLAEGRGRGFHVADEDPDDPWPDAWCDACEEASRGGEWDEAAIAFADVRSLCSGCYEIVRARNVRPRTPEDYRGYGREALAWLHRRLERLERRFELSSHDRFHLDQRSGSLVLSRRGRPRLIASFLIVGSTSKVTDDWLWSWANPCLDAERTRPVLAVREHGTRQGWGRLVEPRWAGADREAWEATAIAARLLLAEGAYRAPCEHGALFVLLRGVRHLD